LYIPLCYGTFHMRQYKQSFRYNYTQNRLPEDKSSGSKDIEDIKKLKIKILI